MTKDEALDLALEALEYWDVHGKLHQPTEEAITAIKQARALDKKAENARELGLDYEPPCKTGSQCTSKCQQCVVPPAAKPATEESSAVEAPVQEVSWGVDWGKAGDIPCVSIIKRLPEGGIQVMAVEYAPYSYTTPPAAQREWVGLTDEEVRRLSDDCIGVRDELEFIRAIEAKLKEKNT